MRTIKVRLTNRPMAWTNTYYFQTDKTIDSFLAMVTEQFPGYFIELLNIGG